MVNSVATEGSGVKIFQIEKETHCLSLSFVGVVTHLCRHSQQNYLSCTVAFDVPICVQRIYILYT